MEKKCFITDHKFIDITNNISIKYGSDTEVYDVDGLVDGEQRECYPYKDSEWWYSLNRYNLVNRIIKVVEKTGTSLDEIGDITYYIHLDVLKRGLTKKELDFITENDYWKDTLWNIWKK